MVAPWRHAALRAPGWAATCSFARRWIVAAVLDLLFATNDRSVDGRLYDMDGDGDANDDWETLLRTLANDVYSAINEQGNL